MTGHRLPKEPGESPWRPPKAPQVSCSGGPCLRRAVGPGDPRGPCQPQLWVGRISSASGSTELEQCLKHQQQAFPVEKGDGHGTSLLSLVSWVLCTRKAWWLSWDAPQPRGEATRRGFGVGSRDGNSLVQTGGRQGAVWVLGLLRACPEQPGRGCECQLEPDLPG